MAELWKVAVSIAGLGAIGAFVFWSLYRSWLHVPALTKLSSRQIYRLFVIFLVLTFLTAIAALLTYLAAKRADSETNRVTEKTPAESDVRDWCLTVRASELLPVYPPSTDLEPGDVFLVDSSIADQARVYNERGFLPLDQPITRLLEIPRAMRAPRVAFRAHPLSLETGEGLKLALPVSCVTLGLGLLGAAQAQGSMVFRGVNTTAADGEAVARRLYEWWTSNADVREQFGAIARDTGEPLYLRVVTSVFSIHGVTAVLVGPNVGTAGPPTQVDLQKLAMERPDLAPQAAAAYREALAALSTGSVRLIQASAQAVTLEEDFECPLAIGYLAFDVRIFANAAVSPPVPSFATVAQGSRALEVIGSISYGEDQNTNLLENFLEDAADYEKLKAWLVERGIDVDPATLLFDSAQADARAEAVAHFGLK